MKKKIPTALNINMKYRNYFISISISIIMQIISRGNNIINNFNPFKNNITLYYIRIIITTEDEQYELFL